MTPQNAKRSRLFEDQLSSSRGAFGVLRRPGGSSIFTTPRKYLETIQEDVTNSSVVSVVGDGCRSRTSCWIISRS